MIQSHYLFIDKSCRFYDQIPTPFDQTVAVLIQIFCRRYDFCRFDHTPENHWENPLKPLLGIYVGCFWINSRFTSSISSFNTVIIPII